MKRLLSHTAVTLLATSMLVVFAGCTHTRVLTADSPDALAEINQRGERSTASVTLITGETVSARSLHFAPDLVTWIDPQTGATTSSHTSDVGSVRFMSRGRGALEGLGVGFLTGAVVGGLVFFLAESGGADCQSCILDFSPGEAALLGIIVIGVPGAAVGGLVGAGRGSRRVFVAPSQMNASTNLRQ